MNTVLQAPPSIDSKEPTEPVAGPPVPTDSKTRTGLVVLIAVAALGYFVDVYDLLLFSVVRKASLQTLGIPDEETLYVGLRLLKWQMVGLLIGGILWGVLGDKRNSGHGRSCLPW